LAKPLVSKKAPGAGATFQMALAPAPVLNFQLSSGSGSYKLWFELTTKF